MENFDQLVRDRHSTRKFLPRTVPRALLDESLALAQLAPSNSNIQPWRMVFATGAARDRLAQTLIDVAQREAPHIPPLPQQFTHFRSELGLEVYGKGMGIKKEDKAGRAAAVLRNFDFFGAPLVGVVCMHRDLGPPDAVSVGMYLQTLLLALTERGLGTCVEVSVAGYPDILRKELGIAEDLQILCGVAIGYSDPNFPANQLHIHRESIEKNTTFYGH